MLQFLCEFFPGADRIGIIKKYVRFFKIAVISVKTTLHFKESCIYKKVKKIHRQRTNSVLVLPLLTFIVIGFSFSDVNNGQNIFGFLNFGNLKAYICSRVDELMCTEKMVALEFDSLAEETSPGLTTNASFQITSTIDLTGTVTIPPVPTYTLEFPEVKPTSQLLQANRMQPEAEITKKESLPFWFSIRRYWPFILVGVIWIALSIWFIFSQLIIE